MGGSIFVDVAKSRRKWYTMKDTDEGGNAVICQMKPEDYDGIYQLWLSCAGMGLNDLDDSREGIDTIL